MSVEILHIVLATLFMTIWLLATWVAVQNPRQTRLPDPTARGDRPGHALPPLRPSRPKPTVRRKNHPPLPRNS